MKNTTKNLTLKSFAFLFLALFSLQSFAQKEIKEGYIVQKMTLSTGDAAMDAQIESMMGDLKAKTFFKGNLSSTEMKNPMSGDTKTVIDMATKKMIVLIDSPMLGKKYKEDKLDLSPEELDDVKFTPNGKTKTVLGYACIGYDAVAKVEGVETNMVMFVTEQIKAPTQYAASFGNKLKGFPMFLELNMTQGGMNMTMEMEVTEIKEEKVDASKFDMTIPEGYTEM